MRLNFYNLLHARSILADFAVLSVPLSITKQ